MILHFTDPNKYTYTIVHCLKFYPDTSKTTHYYKIYISHINLPETLLSVGEKGI